MTITSEQIRAARALLRLEQGELARRAGLSVVTIRRLEAHDGLDRAAPATLDGVRRTLEAAGAEFIKDGVRRLRAPSHDADALYRDLQAISRESAENLSGHTPLTDSDLYGEDGLPA